jgi:hypothetical protein
VHARSWEGSQRPTLAIHHVHQFRLEYCGSFIEANNRRTPTLSLTRSDRCNSWHPSPSDKGNVTRRRVPPPLPSSLSLAISDVADCAITRARMHTNSPDMPLSSPSLTDAFTWMGHNEPSMRARWGSTVVTEERDHLQLKVQQTAA